jgi:hypothetical protein
MTIKRPILSTALLGLCMFCMGALFSIPASAQLWDMLTKPQVTVSLTHPPRLGLNIKKVAFGPANGMCSDEILDRLSDALISNGVEVVDRPHLRSILGARHMSLDGYVDHQGALQMGKLLGSTALIFVNISNCDTERRRNFTDSRGVHTNNAIVDMHIRGTLQTIDLATGRIFSAAPIVQDAELINSSDKGLPEFPPEQAVRDRAIGAAAYDASTMFVQWTEQKKLYFFNDKECNMNVAYALLRANDFNGTVRQSEDNITACKTWPKLKNDSLAHAYYNAGLAYLLINDNQRAMAYLTQSAQMKGGDIVTQTIAEATKSAELDAEMRRVADRTDRFEQDQANAQAQAQANAQVQANAQATAQAQAAASQDNVAPGSPEDRLARLTTLYRKGLITKQDYDTKKAAILKEM